MKAAAPKDSSQPQSLFSSLSSLVKDYTPPEKNKYVSREFQDYAYQLAVELDDLSHKSLYMRLAKSTPRGLLEAARSFVKDANARSKAKLFMWKLRELKGKKTQKND